MVTYVAKYGSPFHAIATGYTGGSRKIELAATPASRGKLRSNGGKRGASGESPCKLRLPHLPRLARVENASWQVQSVSQLHIPEQKNYIM